MRCWPTSTPTPGTNVGWHSRTASSTTPSWTRSNATRTILAGLHGNTQVPKLLGSLSRFVYTGDTADGFAAGFFWDWVVQHHCFATGGHGKDEYFGEPDKLNEQVDGRTAESCNVYNMLKMTRTFFALLAGCSIRRVPGTRAVQPHPGLD